MFDKKSAAVKPIRRASHCCSQQGFSLVELMVAVSIIAMAMAVGVPSLFEWIQSNRIRNGAESVMNGLQLAKAEAVRRNTMVQMTLTTLAQNGAPAEPDWTVTCLNPTATCPGTGMAEEQIQKFSAAEGARGVMVSAGQAGFAFNGMGRLVPSSAVTIEVTNPAGGTCAKDGGPMRCLRITVSSAGQLRMCDPNLPASNPRGC